MNDRAVVYRKACIPARPFFDSDLHWNAADFIALGESKSSTYLSVHSVSEDFLHPDHYTFVQACPLKFLDLEQSPMYMPLPHAWAGFLYL